jgi:hypothetical protein
MTNIRQSIETTRDLLTDVLRELDNAPIQPTTERVFKITFKDEPTTELINWLKSIVYGVCDRLYIDRTDLGREDLPREIFKRIGELNEWAQLEENYRKDNDNGI